MSKQRNQAEDQNRNGLKSKPIDARANYEETLRQAGYIPRQQANQADYDRIGFMSGLEVHQQLLTQKKLFCNCPAGVFHAHDDFDAELVRHMRPTLSELGEYDGTALMEFKTRKNITYRVKHRTTCTYEVDDTPPFPLNRQALDIALRISLLSKLNIVGEVHITRKQYLDGSIPTGFQRTAIIGVEGEIPLKHKKVRLIQLSLEEDSCREISDVGHYRTYKTDRLGMPLIETVTYPDMVNPDEVKEACDYIRFLNRSTGLVRTGIGAGREDVNVSCRGGFRVEIKGVAHTRWIPELTHNECFRQWSLLLLRDKLRQRARKDDWKISHKRLNFFDYKFDYEPLVYARDLKHRIVAVNLPNFRGLISHFTQPGMCFANELSDRLKVIACIEKPNIVTSEDLNPVVSADEFARIAQVLGAGENDAQLLFWGAEDDVPTALETIEERCLMAFDGVPGETRKSFENGTTIFERVLPGADRMYPDTDSAPISLKDDYIQRLRAEVPEEVVTRFHRMKEWGIPDDTYTFIFKKNLYGLIERIVNDLSFNPGYIGTLIGHTLKRVEGQYGPNADFNYDRVYDMLKYIRKNKLEVRLARRMMPVVYQHPSMDFDSVLTTIGFKRLTHDEIIGRVPFLMKKFSEICFKDTPPNRANWIMGQLQAGATGNISLTDLYAEIEMRIA